MANIIFETRRGGRCEYVHGEGVAAGGRGVSVSKSPVHNISNGGQIPIMHFPLGTRWREGGRR